MNVCHRVRHLWKAANSESDYQDAYYPTSEARATEGNLMRYAVADGASEALFSGSWAKTLTAAWSEHRLNFDDGVQGQLRQLSADWAESIDSTNFPWWAEEKLRQGSFSTLTGIELELAEGVARWSVVAVGDSCFFHVRRGEVIEYGPVMRSSDFASRPYLIGTHARSSSDLALHTNRYYGQLEPGDEFFLLTDALSAWFISQFEQRGTYANFSGQLERAVTDQHLFFEWIADLRRNQHIRDDDVTCLWVLVTEL